MSPLLMLPVSPHNGDGKRRSHVRESGCRRKRSTHVYSWVTWFIDSLQKRNNIYIKIGLPEGPPQSPRGPPAPGAKPLVTR